MASPDPNLLLNTFKNQPLTEHGNRWNSLWESQQTDWDRGTYSAPLFEVLTQGIGGIAPAALFPASSSFVSPDSKESRKRKTALVPGCGRGYDVLLLASLGYDVVGLELSPIGIRKAIEFAEESKGNGSYPIKLEGVIGNGDVKAGSFQYVHGDFFKDEWLAELGGKDIKFDLIFDYTFGCALPPSAKPQWSRRLASLLSPAGGRLVCLEFPSLKAPKDQGPPWAMPPHTYLAYLSQPGVEIPTDEHGGVLNLEQYQGRDGQAVEILAADSGLKRLVHAHPATTHKSGVKEGKVVDWISVWCH